MRKNQAERIRMMSEKTPKSVLRPLSSEERNQIKTLATFLGFIVIAIIVVGLLISVLSQQWWG